MALDARDLERRLSELHRAVERFVDELSRGGDLGVRMTITDDAPGNTRGLDRVFAGLGATIDAFPDVLREAVPAIRAAHRATFSTEGAAGRGAWQALAPATLRDRARRGYPPGPILVRSGALRDHVLSTPAVVTRRGDTVELRIQPDPVVEGTGRPYYRAQARGSAHSNLPSRPMVAVGPASAARITSTISRALRARAALHGL